LFRKRIPKNKNSAMLRSELRTEMPMERLRSIISTRARQLNVHQLSRNAWFTLAFSGDFCRFKLCGILVILAHIVIDFSLVIWVDFFK